MSGSEPRVSAEMLRSTSTPDTVESRLGTLEFTDGAPTKATAELLYDHPQQSRSLQHRRRTALRLRADHQHRGWAVRDKA
jgi:hypothetical protein